MLKKQNFPFKLPLTIDKIISRVSSIFWWSFSILIIVTIAMALFEQDSGLYAVPAEFLFWVVTAFLVWVLVSRIIRAFIYRSKAALFIEWLNTNYGYTVNNRKQVYPFMRKSRTKSDFSYASKTVMLWENQSGIEIAVPYSLVETNNGFSLYNLNTSSPELTLDMKKLVEFWEFFWTFSDRAFIPIQNNSVNNGNKDFNDVDDVFGFEFVDFSSPLEEFRKIKIWGDDSSFKDEFEKDELPYSVASISSMPALVSMLNYFNDGNTVVEIDFRNKKTVIPIAGLIGVVQQVYNSKRSNRF